jgi:hypothetical protein
MHLVTGPNMGNKQTNQTNNTNINTNENNNVLGGKSTFLRQNALLAVMAQAGSFVPAQSFELGVVDAVVRLLLLCLFVLLLMYDCSSRVLVQLMMCPIFNHHS